MKFITEWKQDNINCTSLCDAPSTGAAWLWALWKFDRAEVVGVRAVSELNAEANRPGMPTYNAAEMPAVGWVIYGDDGIIYVGFKVSDPFAVDMVKICAGDAHRIEVLEAIGAGHVLASDGARRVAFNCLNTLKRDEEKRKTEEENRRRCLRIANEIEQVAAGDLVRCPECGEMVALAECEEVENEDGDTVRRCSHCSAEFDEWYADSVGMWDYFDDIYNVEYTIDGDGDYRGCSLMVACGGPSIYVDTNAGAVVLRWWGDSTCVYLSSTAVEAVDDFAREMWECVRG